MTKISHDVSIAFTTFAITLLGFDEAISLIQVTVKLVLILLSLSVCCPTEWPPPLLCADTGRVEKASRSLFPRIPQEEWDELNDPSFVPVFQPKFTSSELNATATTVCSGEEECLFDVAASGRLEVGLATLEFVKEYKKFLSNYMSTGVHVCVCVCVWLSLHMLSPLCTHMTDCTSVTYTQSVSRFPLQLRRRTRLLQTVQWKLRVCSE